jgi:oligogalacturonide transport system substrate-binding protein
MGLTREELIEMFSFYRRLIDNHAIVPLQLRSNISGNMEQAPNEIPNYLDGRWAAHYGWDATVAVNSMETGKTFELAIPPYPTQDGAKNSGLVGRPNMVWTVSKNSPNPELAAKLINMLVNDPRSIEFQKVDRGVPVSKAAFQALVDKNLVIPLAKAGAEQLQSSGVSLSHPHLENPRVLTPYMATIEQVSHAALTPEEAADRILDEIGRVLTRLNRE